MQYFFMQLEVKTKPIETHLQLLSCALGQLLEHVITLSFDWFTDWSASLVIVWVDYFGFT